MEEQTLKLTQVIERMHLEPIYLPENYEEILVTAPRVNRPGLQLDGFYDYYEKERIQILGKVENVFLEKLDDQTRKKRIEEFIKTQPPAIIYTTHIQVHEEMLQYAKKYQVPVLRTEERTSQFMAALIGFLDEQLAPCITRHGVLVEVYGEGILLLGDSGIGKSETAIELVKRGHRLIADDAVEIKRISETSLLGKAPESIRHYVELRGIGIVDVRRLFGMSAIKESTEINLIVELEVWRQDKVYDRMGLEDETKNIMGIDIPSYTIPVSPGRNLAIIIEVAAMNHRLKTLGYNTAKEFNEALLREAGITL